LYEEVWTEPTQKVAQRYGVSDVAIAKACWLGVRDDFRHYLVHAA
jgi:hypothetical protein